MKLHGSTQFSRCCAFEKRFKKYQVFDDFYLRFPYVILVFCIFDENKHVLVCHIQSPRHVELAAIKTHGPSLWVGDVPFE